MHKQLLTVNEVTALINAGKTLLLAGDETLLSPLPNGKWIGGTSANFMTSDGGVTCQDKLYVTDITQYAADIEIKKFNVENLKEFPDFYMENGFAVIILPAMTDIQINFAKEVQDYKGVFNSPLIGWVSGIHVNEIGKRDPKVFSGIEKMNDNEAVIMYVKLPKNMFANINIVNFFTQGKGVDIEFTETGFSTGDCLINGEVKNLAAYVTENNWDLKLPLVADYNGAMINAGFQTVDLEKGTVSFYGPLFPNIKYRHAMPVDYNDDRLNQGFLGHNVNGVAFSCNCILNFLYAELETKKTGEMVGPMTFGEIAYVLLTQTLVYLKIQKF
jgi:hypothetical protein